MRRTTLVSRFGPAIALVLAALVMGGCAPSFKYSYNTQNTFPELKTYQWAASSGDYLPDPLLVPNVQFIADQDLAAKGFTRAADNAQLLIWMNYQSDYQAGFQIRRLTLNVARADNRKMIWQGTADGSMKTDAASKQLEGIVQRILSSFPPA